MRGALSALLVLCTAARSFAQPAAPDYDKAQAHYDAGTQAMEAGQFDLAAKEFLAAYGVTEDPVLFFKIGSAYERASEQDLARCNEALSYFQRYLDEANPEPQFVELTRQRIEGCRTRLAGPATDDQPAEAPPTTEAAPVTRPSRDKDRAWLFVGGALTFVTAGAVLAYSTSSAEQDIKDLYISNDGKPPKYDDQTRKRYENLMREGRRYELLAWTSFGLAAGCAMAATIFFLRDDGDLTVTPVVTPTETGVSATLRF